MHNHHFYLIVAIHLNDHGSGKLIAALSNQILEFDLPSQYTH